MSQKLGVEFKPRSHVPGYCGYIPGAKSENLYGKTYGKITEEVTKTQEDLSKQRFTTTNVNNNLVLRNELLGQQSPNFWTKDQNITAFNGENSQKKQTTLNRQKFIPQPQTNLTYEQAIKKI